MYGHTLEVMPFEKGHPYYPPADGAAPTGLSRAARIAKRNLAIVLQEMVSEEAIGKALIAIAFEGRWPRGLDDSDAKKILDAAPDGAQRMMAIKYLLERRNGMPMQSVVLQAEIEARHRTLSNADDVIDVESIDVTAARALEAALGKALALGEPDED